MMAVDHMILSAANSCRALYRTHGRFSPVMPRLGFTFPVRPVERLQDQGKLAWSDTSRRSAELGVAHSAASKSVASLRAFVRS